MFNSENNEQMISEDEFEEFSKLFNSPLPPAFKNHYMKNNGAKVPEAFRESHPGVLNSFLSIKYGDLTIENVVNRYMNIDSKNFAWKDGEFIPFACDDGGNIYFISLRVNDYGKIFIHSLDGDVLSNISSSFEDFLEKLEIS